MAPFQLIWAGENKGAVRVDDFPNPLRTYKTIAMHVFDFDGVITIEGSLATNPGPDDWFTYHVETFTRPPITSSKLQNLILTKRDRVIWLRCTVVSSPSVYTGRAVPGRVDRILVM